MEYFYYAIWALIPLSLITLAYGGRKWEDWGVGLLVTGIFLNVPNTIALLAVYTSTADNLGTIKAQAPIIAHYENYVEELDKQLSEIKGQEGFTFTADTPVHSLVAAKTGALRDLLSARKAIDVAKMNIEQARLGLLGFVVEWVEDDR